MKTQHWFGLWVVAALLAGTATVSRAQTMVNVYQAQITLKGVVPNPAASPVSLPYIATTSYLINLALGNNFLAKVPTNEVLAVVAPADGGPGGQLVVWDTAGKTNLAVIGSFDSESVRTSPTKKVSAALVSIGNTGNESFGLTGGNLMLNLTFIQPQGQAISKVTGTATGWVEVTITVGSATESGKEVFTSGKFSASFLETVTLP